MASSAQVHQSRREQLQQQKLAIAAKERRTRIIFVAIGIVVIAIVAALAIWGLSSANSGGGTSVPPNSDPDKNGILLAPATAGAPTLELFSDFNCSACKAADATLHQALVDAATSGKATVIIHSMSFEAASSRPAAIASACSDFQGKFADFYHQLYLSQSDGLDTTALTTTIPDKVGLSGDALTAYQQCVANEETGSFVTAETNYAAKMKVGSTPTFLLDGKNVTNDIYNKATGSWDPDKLRAVLGIS